MAPRGVCAHLPCVGQGEFSSRASSECGSEEPTVGEWDRRRRYRQLVQQQAGHGGHYQGGGGGGHYRQLVDQKGYGYYRYPAEAEQSSGQYKQLKELVDCSNEHILLPTETYPENGDIVDEEEDEEEASLPLEIAEHFLVDSSNLYAKVRPKNRRSKLQQLEVSETPNRNFESFQKSADSDHQPANQHQLMTQSFSKRQPEKNLGPTRLSSIPEASSVLSPTISATDARLAQLRREMSANTSAATKSTRGEQSGTKEDREPKKAPKQNPPLPRLPPVCGRSPPCHCPEDRELAAKLRLRIIKKISTLRRKHLRLRVIPFFFILKSLLTLNCEWQN